MLTRSRFDRAGSMALGCAAALVMSTAAFADIITIPDLPTEVPPGPVSGTLLADDYVGTLATFAYVWGWPLVNLHERHLAASKVTESALAGGILPVAPLNRLTMLTDTIRPDERSVATPSRDTVYGYGMLSLDKGPVVFQVPDFGGRYWLYQLGDQRTDAIAGIGSAYGTRPGIYMVVGPDYNGIVPPGIAGVFRSPTNIATLIPQLFVDGTAEDRAAVQPLVGQIMAYPLGEFKGTMKSFDWSKIPTLADPAAGKGGETRWVRPETFFDELPAVLAEVPPQPGEEALYAQLRWLTGAAAKDPKLEAALVKAAVAADKGVMTELRQYRYAGVPVDNGWTSPQNGAHFGTDYYSRAALARADIFVTPRSEVARFGIENDFDGKRLNGKRSYTVTFPKDGTPPVDGFWSLTLYDADHFFAPNKIGRYSIGTTTKDLKYNADGSLTIYVQNAPPAGDQKANWLPAPKGDFELFLRAYGPQGAILGGRWSPPPVFKAR